MNIISPKWEISLCALTLSAVLMFETVFLLPELGDPGGVLKSIRFKSLPVIPDVAGLVPCA